MSLKQKKVLTIVVVLVLLLTGLYLYQQNEESKNVKTLKIDTPFTIDEDGETKDLDFEIEIRGDEN